jgi:hypothetical protein
MSAVNIRVDVTSSLAADISAGARLIIDSWIFLPQRLRAIDGLPVVIALLNGGSYDKRYFDIQLPGIRTIAWPNISAALAAWSSCSIIWAWARARDHPISRW